jgi:hypothetical protein
MAAVAYKNKGNIAKGLVYLIAIGAILYLGYRVSKGITGFFSSFKFPEIKFPEIKFPEIQFPTIVFPTQPMTPQQMTTQFGVLNQQMQSNQTPVSPNSTGLVDVPPMLVDQLTQDAREKLAKGLVPFTQPSGQIIYVTPETAKTLEQRYYGMPQPQIMVNPNQYLPNETNVPNLLKMGLAIDMPTKMGQDTFVNRIVQGIQQTERQQGSATVSTVVTLSGLARQNPNLTASQLADLRARLLGDFPQGFNFGTNTGSGRLYQFNEMGMVIGSTRNPVLQAYEAYRAMYA